MADNVPPLVPTIVGAASAPAGWTALATADLLAEPATQTSTQAPEWVGCAYLRILVAAGGPVAVAGPGLPADARARLDAAGWPIVAPDADPAAARAAYWPTLDRLAGIGWGVGAPHPRLVLVGETDPVDRGRPFLSRSGVWLLRGLRELGHDELTVYLANACRGHIVQRAALRDLCDLFAPREPTWVALGKEAARALRGAKIVHVAAEHPSHAMRWAWASGPDGYARRLRAAGVPAGPWAGAAADPGAPPLPVCPVPDGAPLPALAAWHLPRSIAYRAEGARPASEGRGGNLVAREVRERVHEAYVRTGRPVADLAREEGLSPGQVRAMQDRAREEDWIAEARDREDQVRAAARAKTDAAEVDDRVAARRLGAGSLALALRLVYDRIAAANPAAVAPETRAALAARVAAGTLDPLMARPQDAESLARAVALMAEYVPPGTDEDLDRLRELPPAERLRSYAGTLVAQYGLDVARIILDSGGAAGAAPPAGGEVPA